MRSSSRSPEEIEASMNRAIAMMKKKRQKEATKAVISAKIIFFIASGLSGIKALNSIILGVEHWSFILLGILQLAIGVVLLMIGLKVKTNPQRLITIGLLSFCAYFILDKVVYILAIKLLDNVSIPFFFWLFNLFIISFLSRSIKKAKYYDENEWQKSEKIKQIDDDEILDV